MLERVEKGQLVDGSQATCAELKNVLEVDRATIRGPLAEMLGFAPLSDATRKMLAPPA